MTQQFTLSIETAKRLSAQQERRLARDALALNPGSRLMRARLAALLTLDDAFAETIALLEPATDLSFAERMALIMAYLALENTEADHAAVRHAQSAARAAEDDRQQAAALAELAKAQVRLGQAEARETLIHALTLDPHSKNACKRLATWHMKRSEFSAVLDFSADLLERGVGHSRLFAARVMALAECGRMDEAIALDGLRQLGHRALLPVPAGFDSLEAFNRALAEQILNHPELRYERYGTASELTWRVDSPQSIHAPLIGVLLKTIAAEAERHVRSLRTIDHPWLRIGPPGGMLHCWSVITEDSGYETWHVRQFGWMSGTYYVQIPEGISKGNGPGGCLAFGLPDDQVSAQAALSFGQEFVRPQAGMLSLFPSHSYHRTFAHNLNERRICVAFDIWPTDG
ncbi:MAG: hypothetical protein J0M19_02405 [Sphingomonadales bacterium]|nr:hypothetical protein [Sphingomonadales bacterium]